MEGKTDVCKNKDTAMVIEKLGMFPGWVENGTPSAHQGWKIVPPMS